MHVDDLALFGGTPTFAEKKHVGRPNLGDKATFFARVDDIWERRWLTNNGRYVQEFEQRVAETLRVGHCIATSSGTMALEIAIRALGMTGEVIVPSFTFIATAHALKWQGLTPVFADVDDTHNLDPRQVERLITPQTSGILGVHLWGRPCDTDALEAIAQKHCLQLLFDASHAFGGSHHGRMIGHFGDAEVFSFHATKYVNALEGGAIVTNSAEVAQRARQMINHGMAGRDVADRVGTNAKMTEISAAMGLTSLAGMDGFIAHNRAMYHEYRCHLANLPGVRLIEFDERERCNYQYIVLEVDAGTTGISRDDLVAVLQGENVLAKRYFHPGCHEQEPYRTEDPTASQRLPKTLQLASQVMALPTGTGISAEDVARIAAIIRLAVSHGPEISRRLAATGN
jgi:dTDP-4-amino-4,6-dideoxygalactose transaminase